MLLMMMLLLLLLVAVHSTPGSVLMTTVAEVVLPFTVRPPAMANFLLLMLLCIGVCRFTLLPPATADRLPAAAAAESALADVPLPQLPPAVFVRIAAFPAEVEVDAEMVDEWAVPREKAEEPAPVPRPVEPPLAEDALEQLLVMLAGVGGLMSQLLRKFSSMSGSSLLPLWLLPAPV